MEPDYKVKLEVFEGPLDLLLYLIKKDEVDIYDISIERITQHSSMTRAMFGSDSETSIPLCPCFANANGDGM